MSEPPEITRRKAMAGAFAGLSLFFGDLFGPDPLHVTEDGNDVAEGVETIDFGDNVSVSVTDDGIRVDIDGAWTETTDGGGREVVQPPDGRNIHNPNVTTLLKSVGVGAHPTTIGEGTFTGDGRRSLAIQADDYITQLGGEVISGTASDQPRRSSFRARGSPGSKAAVSDGDNLADWVASGYDGDQYQAAGAIEIDVDGSVSTGTVPTRKRLILTDTGGTQFVHSLSRPDGVLELKNGGLLTPAGSSSSLAQRFAGGAGFYVDSNGEIIAVDEAGNETTIS